MNFGKKADYVHFEATSFSFDITVYQTANIVNLNNQLLGLVTLSRVTYVFIFNLNVSWNRAICASDFELQHSQMRKKKPHENSLLPNLDQFCNLTNEH